MLRVKNKGGPRDIVYSWGQQGVLGIVEIEDKQQNDAKCLQSYTRCITQENASVFPNANRSVGFSPGNCHAQKKQKIFHKLVDKRKGCRFIIYNIRAKIFGQGALF